ncbi:hypothetical protein N9D38_12370, partial [Rubripirellula sp.]|nr:hypothetical protein [Rubripirellula sp.]
GIRTRLRGLWIHFLGTTDAARQHGYTKQHRESENIGLHLWFPKEMVSVRRRRQNTNLDRLFKRYGVGIPSAIEG